MKDTRTAVIGASCGVITCSDERVRKHPPHIRYVGQNRAAGFDLCRTKLPFLQVFTARLFNQELCRTFYFYSEKKITCHCILFEQANNLLSGTLTVLVTSGERSCVVFSTADVFVTLGKRLCVVFSTPDA